MLIIVRRVRLSGGGVIRFFGFPVFRFQSLLRSGFRFLHSKSAVFGFSLFWHSVLSLLFFFLIRKSGFSVLFFACLVPRSLYFNSVTPFWTILALGNIDRHVRACDQVVGHQ